MANYVVKTHKLKLAALDVSAFVEDCALSWGVEALDSTAMGATAHARTAGLITWSIDATLLQDAVDSSVDNVVYDAMVAGTIAVKVCPGVAGSTTESAGNPIYRGTGVVESYVPIQGNVGEMAKMKLKIRAGGDLTRDVDPAAPNW